ncbi:probable calcium-binding protein CML25/26 [Triticum aestivum]|uniref:probable calcium-binding protein CML25/26 n=1 Tax=Triticum aestivum TaxID=4565 RepID=UPI001D01C7C8|nr:probable calcium-binding protein CML25/26 [Triticum aestivum]
MAVPSVFTAFDTDGDDKMSASELQRCMEATLGEGVSEEEAVAVLAAVDADGDGLPNQGEFSRLVAGAEGEDDANVKRRCLRDAFGMYASSPTEDTITPASLRRTLSRLGLHELGVEECRAMICRFDLDGDGKLSFDKFRVMMMA